MFLSKYNERALRSFGFTSYKEAFNVFGYALKVQPSSIKNYRDEFDPYFPNERKGWHNREFRDYCKVILERFNDMPFDNMYMLISSFLQDEQVDVKDVLRDFPVSKQRQFAINRMITGKAAEQYFEKHYRQVVEFTNFAITNTTSMGCGFDYKLSQEDVNYYVEVKGINGMQGNILMTEKEHNMASMLVDKYCLFVVCGFKDIPVHRVYFDPLHSNSLLFQRNERMVKQISYSAKCTAGDV